MLYIFTLMFIAERSTSCHFFVQWLQSEHLLRSKSKKPELIPKSLHSATFYRALLKGCIVAWEVREHIKRLLFLTVLQWIRKILIMQTPLGERTITVTGQPHSLLGSKVLIHNILSVLKKKKPNKKKDK